jgi:membrane-bound lytic murein transglycosylase B
MADDKKFKLPVGKQKPKLMHDPYNFAAVTEKFRKEQQAEKAEKQRVITEKKKVKAEKQRVIAEEKKEKKQKARQKELAKIDEDKRKLNVLKSKLANIKAKGVGAGTKGPIVKIQDPMLIREKENLRLANKYRKMNMGGVMKNRGGTFKGVY